jgi:hypothetical protein
MRPVTGIMARSIERGHMTTGQFTLPEVLRRIRAEYRESPGMRLTKAQVQRFWQLDAMTCDAVIGQLLDTGFLRRTRADFYVRAEA